MIIENGIISTTKNEATLKTFEIDHFKIFYKGFIFTYDKKVEYDGFQKIIKIFKKNSRFNFNEIQGVYIVHVVDNKTKNAYTFTDNSGMFKAYCAENIISTSFLELTDHLNVSKRDLDFKAVSEFLHFGFVHFNKTFIKKINRLGSDDFIIWEKGRKIIKKKGLDQLNNTSLLPSFLGFFDCLQHVLQNKKVSLSLTGGIDSRLICGLLNHFNIDFELAISGIKGNTDIEIAKIIASKIGKKLHVTYHSPETFSENELQEIFSITDAQCDLIQYHRLYQYNRDRQSRAIDIQISGVGGELYKDFWWLQDFPFYAKRNSNIERLYNLRIENFKFPHNLLGENVKHHSKNLKLELLEKLKIFTHKINTQTYDSIYYHYKMNGMAATYTSTINNSYFVAYAPLVERELVKIGFNLKRRKRFYNNFHRELLTKYSPEISKIRTTENITCSNKALDKILDIPKYIFNKQVRTFKQALRKISNKTYFQENPTDPRVYEIARSLDSLNLIEATLKQIHTLNDQTNISELPNDLLGKFLTLGIFVKGLKE